MLILTIGTGRPALATPAPAPEATFGARYKALLERQSQLYFSRRLSNLRVSYTYAQLWYYYNNVALVYWNQEAANLQQIMQTYTANPFQGDALAVQSRLYDVMAEVAYGNSVVFKDLNSYLHTSQWLQRWQSAMAKAALTFAHEVTRLETDFPAFKTYGVLSGSVARTGQAVLVNAAVTDQVAKQYRQFTQRYQAILSRVDYTQHVASLQQRWHKLMTTDRTLQGLNERGTHLAGSLNELQQRIHAAVTTCLYRYGASYYAYCIDPTYNTDLLSLVPYKSTASARLLRQTAGFQEAYSKGVDAFSRRRDVAALQQQLEAKLKPVAPDLRQAENRFISAIKAMPETSQLGNLLRRLVQAARRLVAP